MELLEQGLMATWVMTLDAAPYILFGFLMAGALTVWLPEGLVAKILGGNIYWQPIKGALVGAPLPLCSCSVIPTAVSLRKMGASKGATSAFLIATPETGVDSISVSYALLDPLMTIIRPLAAIVTAIVAGLLEVIWGDQKGEEGYESTCSCKKGEEKCDSPTSTRGSLFALFHFAFIEMMDDLAVWMVVGLVAAGFVQVVVPDDFFASFAGGSFGSMIAMLFFGAPLYICATSSTPLAAALMLKGLSPGAALVFLLVGPATNVGTIMIVRRLMGFRSALIYLGSIVVCALLFGMGLDALYPALQIEPSALTGEVSAMIPDVVQFWSALLFTLLAARSFMALYLPERVKRAIGLSGG